MIELFELNDIAQSVQSVQHTLWHIGALLKGSAENDFLAFGRGLAEVSPDVSFP
jgi:hypothetical protein